jgi:uncharacterized lipoprotein
MLRSVALAICCVTLLSSCGVFSALDRVVPDRRTEYRRAESLPDLEVPPDLSVDAIQDRMAIPQAGASYSTYQQRRAGARNAETGSARVEMVEVGDGKSYLSLNEELRKAWDSVAAALAQADIEVEEADQDLRVFHVRYGTGEKKGFLFWKREDAIDYQVNLIGVGDKTEIVVLNEDGEWDTGEPAGRLMDRLYAQLR